MRTDEDREQYWRTLTDQVARAEGLEELVKVVAHMDSLLKAIEKRMAELTSGRIQA